MDWMDDGVDTPETIMTTKAPGVLRIISGGLRNCLVLNFCPTRTTMNQPYYEDKRERMAKHPYAQSSETFNLVSFVILDSQKNQIIRPNKKYIWYLLFGKLMLLCHQHMKFGSFTIVNVLKVVFP